MALVNTIVGALKSAAACRYAVPTSSSLLQRHNRLALGNNYNGGSGEFEYLEYINLNKIFCESML